MTDASNDVTRQAHKNGFLLRVAVASVAALICVIAAARVQAIPIFAHRYGLSCQTCHTVVPHLTPFGERFLASGYRISGAAARGVVPLAVKVNLTYSSEPSGAGLPKALVDEVELLSGGALTKRVEYFLESYLVDGGLHGSLRDAWAAYRVPAIAGAKIPFKVVAGQFTVPLPVDPETFRETSAHYSIFDQTVGADPFNFFDPKAGLQFVLGNPAQGTSVNVALLDGHDKQSGLRRDGIDRMLYAQYVLGAFVPSAYRYEGQRPLCPQGDRFWRQGYGLAYTAGRLSLDGVLQSGFDSCPQEMPAAERSSGGFLQARFAFPSGFGIVRFDQTREGIGSPSRSLLIGGGMRASRNSRLTLEDVITHIPVTKHALYASMLIAY